jgi:fumarate hydratase class II
MVAAQVIGYDTTITVAGQAGNFQLNVMLPVIAYDLLESIRLLANVLVALADRAIAGFTVNRERLAEALDRNPILVTALNPIIGYEQGAAIVKQAYAEGRPIREVAQRLTNLSAEELARLLDPLELTRGGVKGGGGGGG